MPSEMSSSVMISINSKANFDEMVSQNPGRLHVCHFATEWCAPSPQINDVLLELKNIHPELVVSMVDAEKSRDLVKSFKIQAVPTLIFVKNGKLLHSIEGVKIAEISKTVDRLLKEAGNPLLVAMPSLPPKESPQTRIESLIRSNPCMVFMKGTPKDARCGFSRQLIELLDRHGCPYASFNILEDEEIRQQLKEYSNWPTFPQLYINREFIGGLDIAKELDTSGDLAKMLPKREPVTAEVLATGQSSLETRLTALINKSKVMLFMKGTPSVPECGFSSQIVDLLGKVNAKFESFNIFEDEEVRQGLKSFSNWPTYPQLYVNGELIGGVDIVKELYENDELSSLLASS